MEKWKNGTRGFVCKRVEQLCKITRAKVVEIEKQKSVNETVDFVGGSSGNCIELYR